MAVRLTVRVYPPWIGCIIVSFAAAGIFYSPFAIAVPITIRTLPNCITKCAFSILARYVVKMP